jgi:arylsulfatase A-like enzyme
MRRARFEGGAADGLRASLVYGLVSLLTPICATLAVWGGADWHLFGGLRVSWYAEPTAWAIWALVVAIAVLEPRAASWNRLPRVAGLVAFVLATGILWTGGGELGPVSLRNPTASFWVGTALLVVAGRRGWRWAPARWRMLRGLALATLVGCTLQLALVRIDARELQTAIGVDRSSVERAMRRQRSNVVWIVVDTLRADALGNDRPGRRTPNLDRLAHRSVVFDEAYATAPWTLPSMMSLFTARYPSTLDPIGRGRAAEVDRLPRLASRIPTWIRSFRAAGYHTAGFQKNPFLAPGSGFETDFDLYRMVGGDRAEGESAAQLVRSVLRWADVVSARPSRGDPPPFFLYVHFMDPHIDYQAPEHWASKATRDYAGSIDGHAGSLHDRLATGVPIDVEDRAQLERLYEAEVAYLDSEIGRLLSGLESRGLLDASSWVVFSADHGEQFGEHGGWEHGDLHVENVRVPFWVAGPGLVAQRVAHPISNLDLGPTLLDLAGLPPLEGADGRSRRILFEAAPHLDSPAVPIPAPIWVEYGRRLRLGLDRWVLLFEEGGESQLYDARSDPEEVVELGTSQPERVIALKALAEAHVRRRVETQADALDSIHPSGLDPEWREALRELGYVW